MSRITGYVPEELDSHTLNHLLSEAFGMADEEVRDEMLEKGYSIRHYEQVLAARWGTSDRTEMSIRQEVRGLIGSRGDLETARAIATAALDEFCKVCVAKGYVDTYDNALLDIVFDARQA